MGNKYYTHHSIKDTQEASIFSNVYTWTIFDILRSAGPKGLTAPDIQKQIELELRTSVSVSKIYDLLKRLYEGKWIHRYYDREIEKQRCSIAWDWGGIIVEEDFEKAIIEKEGSFIHTNLFPVFLQLLKRTIEDFKEDPSVTKWLPQMAEYCKVCRGGISHEAHEFFSSLLDEATAEFMDSKEFKEFMKNNKYSAEEEYLRK